jgi:pSer/pThr/pTyr-binding forkhead associated (FHA) protein
LTRTITIGRGEHNTIVLTDTTVSRTHAIITAENGKWILTDLGSANGTINKGKRITTTVLTLRDSFRIGSTSFEVCEQNLSGNNTHGSQTKSKSRDGVITTLAECFDEKGVVDRQAFFRSTKILAPHHERISQLLLHRLKADTKKESRLSILNALFLLYHDVPGPRRIIQVLLEEFCMNQGEIRHYERNLLMLASMLLHNSRKQDAKVLEQTPLEVLQEQQNPDDDTIKMAQQILSRLHDKIVSKRATLHRSLIKSLSDGNGNGSTTLTPRFLLSLTREFYILMGLIGGPKAKGIVYDAALAVSSPGSQLYHQPRSKAYSEIIFGLGRVIIQSYLRLLTDDQEDCRKRELLRARLLEFVSSVKDATQQAHLRQVIRLLERTLVGPKATHHGACLELKSTTKSLLGKRLQTWWDSLYMVISTILSRRSRPPHLVVRTSH